MINFSQRDKILDLNDDDPTLFYELDPEQFIKDLKQQAPHNWDPLPINIMCVHLHILLQSMLQRADKHQFIRWAWAEIDKKGNGVISRKDMYWLMKKYNSTVALKVNVEKLIKKCDKNHDRILDASEIHELLSVRGHRSYSFSASPSHSHYAPMSEVGPSASSRIIL